MVTAKESYNSNNHNNDELIMIDQKILLVKFGFTGFSQLNASIKFDSLPSIFKTYLKSPRLFDSKKMEQINIHTASNEILGYDTNGKVFNKKDKVIIHTHGVPFESFKNNSFSIENTTLSDEEFQMLLEGRVSGYFGGDKQIRVYREGELNKGRISTIKFPCINILRADNYIRDPNHYCNELEYTESVKGFERNGLLISRTMQEPEKLMQFIKEDVHYFRQTSPLIEPIILSCVDKLFNKYAKRVMPLILTDGEITKEANDTVDIFNSVKAERYTYFAVTIAVNGNEKKEIKKIT
jgi:hypothetical protein